MADHDKEMATIGAEGVEGYTMDYAGATVMRESDGQLITMVGDGTGWYYKDDGTYVVVQPNGDEFHYPPEGAMAQYGYDEAGNPLDNHAPPVQPAAYVTPTAADRGVSAGGAAAAARSQTPQADAGMGRPPLAPAPGADVSAPMRHGDAAGAAPVIDWTGRQAPTEDELKMHRIDADDVWILYVFREAFHSLFFKLWCSYLLFSVLIIVWTFGSDMLFATLFRVFAPPDASRSSFWQSMGFICLFVCLSFLIATFLTLIVDMLRDIWQATRATRFLWGFGWSETQPPHMVTMFLVVSQSIVPFFWSLILTAARERSFDYFVGFFFYIATLITIWICIAIFVWMFIQAIRRKSVAYSTRAEDEKERIAFIKRTDPEGEIAKAHSGTTVVNARGEQIDAVNWYDSDAVLEEYGMDQKSLTWMLFVFLLGQIPIIIIVVVMATEGTEPTWNVGWIVVAAAFIFILGVLRELVQSNNRGRAAIGAILLMLVFVLLGLIGVGQTGNPTLFGVFLVSLVVTHFLLLRKRPYAMQAYEVDRWGPSAEFQEEQCDTYLCTCKNTCLAIISCAVDVDSAFGKKSVAVTRHEKAERKQRMSLWTDQRLLLNFWVIFWIMLLIAMLFGRTFSLTYGDVPVARRTVMGGAIIPGRGNDVFGPIGVCGLAVNPAARDIGGTDVTGMPTGTNVSLTAYDLSLLAVLSYSWGSAHEEDFNRWFHHFPSFQPVPEQVASGSGDAVGKRPYVRYTTYVDHNSTLNIVVARSINRGVSWMRNVDVWGGSIAFQIASILVPSMSVWPDKAKSEFVSGAQFLKDFYQGNNATEGLEQYLLRLKAAGRRVVVIGHGFNGGLGRLAARRVGVPSIAFNSPGTDWIERRFGATNADPADHISIGAADDLYTSLDSSKTVGRFVTPCHDVYHQRRPTAKCADIVTTARAIVYECGDPYGRTVEP